MSFDGNFVRYSKPSSFQEKIGKRIRAPEDVVNLSKIGDRLRVVKDFAVENNVAVGLFVLALAIGGVAGGYVTKKLSQFNIGLQLGKTVGKLFKK